MQRIFVDIEINESWVAWNWNLQRCCHFQIFISINIYEIVLAAIEFNGSNFVLIH